ncbi:dihydrofolate reductase family protein [Bradyrhizobium sp. 168]|uniref:dihydrofolate reductase family protein n=1 Tax=Bradyrhizobium sp. 168 TaxID=2782639 RepID=UPI0032119E1D
MGTNHACQRRFARGGRRLKEPTRARHWRVRGAGFAAALIEQGLVDEFQFYVNPAVLGDGVRIFAASGFRKLKLLEAKAYSSGMVVSRYTSSPERANLRGRDRTR